MCNASEKIKDLTSSFLKISGLSDSHFTTTPISFSPWIYRVRYSLEEAFTRHSRLRPMFSLILVARSVTMPLSSSSGAAAPFSRAFAAISSPNLIKSGLRATKSVSEESSTNTACEPSSFILIITLPALVALPARFSRAASPFSLSSFSAFAKSPSVDTRAFLHSIIPAPVFSRSFFTSPALISAIFFSLYRLLQNQPDFAGHYSSL